MIEALAGTVRVIIGPLGSVSVSTMKEDTKTLDTGVIGSTVNVELDIVRVSSPLTEELAGAVRVRTGPLGSVSVSTIEEATDMLDAVGIGSTVNVELDIVRVSSPLIEALAGNVKVMKDPPGCESVSMIKDADPLGVKEADPGGIKDDDPLSVRELDPVSVKEVDPLGATVGSAVNVELDIVRVSSPVIEALAGRVRVIKDPPGCVSVSTINDADPLVVKEVDPVGIKDVDVEEPDPVGNKEVEPLGVKGLEKEVPTRAVWLDRLMFVSMPYLQKDCDDREKRWQENM